MTASLRKKNHACCTEALGRLLLQYAPMVRSICAQRLGCNQCDDLQQEAFLRVLRTCHKVRNPRHLPAYIRAVTRNLVSDRIRAKVARPKSDADNELLDELPSPAVDEDKRHEHERLREQIRALPVSLRRVLELFYYCRLDYAEIANRTGLTIGAVGQRLSRARRRLRERLAG